MNHFCWVDSTLHRASNRSGTTFFPNAGISFRQALCVLKNFHIHSKRAHLSEGTTADCDKNPPKHLCSLRRRECVSAPRWRPCLRAQHINQRADSSITTAEVHNAVNLTSQNHYYAVVPPLNINSVTPAS